MQYHTWAQPFRCSWSWSEATLGALAGRKIAEQRYVAPATHTLLGSPAVAAWAPRYNPPTTNGKISSMLLLTFLVPRLADTKMSTAPAVSGAVSEKSPETITGPVIMWRMSAMNAGILRSLCLDVASTVSIWVGSLESLGTMGAAAMHQGLLESEKNQCVWCILQGPKGQQTSNSLPDEKRV